MAYDIRKGDHYAAHVTEACKDARLKESLAYADRIERGECDNCLIVWQRVLYAVYRKDFPILP